jgi:hypothetical protein
MDEKFSWCVVWNHGVKLNWINIVVSCLHPGDAIFFAVTCSLDGPSEPHL